MSCSDNALWIGLLQGGHGVCRPVEFQVCHRRRRLHSRTGGVRDDLLPLRSGVCERNLHDLYRLGCGLHGWKHVLHSG